MSITRRGLLAGIFASAAAPVFVKASSLMPIVAPKIILPRYFSWNPDLTVLRSNRKYLDEAIRRNVDYGKFARGQTAGIYHVDELAYFDQRIYRDLTYKHPMLKNIT